MTKKQQSRAKAKAAAKSRPQAAAQPRGTSTSTFAPLTAFSPSTNDFALVTQALNRQRLTIFEHSNSAAAASSSRLVVDYIVASASRCTAVAWTRIPSSKRQQKKPRPSYSVAPEATSSASLASARPVVALAFESGQIQIFDPALGKVVQVLADPASAAFVSKTIMSLSTSTTFRAARIYATGKDGRIRMWELAATSQGTSEPLSPTSIIAPTPASTVPNNLVSVSPSSSYLLAASHSISQIDASNGNIVAQYAAHASPLTHLIWLDETDSYFLSAASNDPVLCIWKTGRKTPVATVELEQGEDVVRVHSAAGVLVIVGSQGFVGLFSVASIIKPGASPANDIQVIPAVATTSSPLPSLAIDAKLDQSAERLSVCRLIKSIKLDISSTSIRDVATSHLKSSLTLPNTAHANLLASGDEDVLSTGVSDLQRYKDPTTATGRQRGVASGSIVGEDGNLIRGDALNAEDAGALDPETGGVEDERTLEERLRGMKVMRHGGIKKTRDSPAIADDRVDEKDEDDQGEEGEDGPRLTNVPTTSLSLATSLSQALHSSDSALLSSLLTSANPQLIKSTVLRISGPSAVKLLEACVERLHRGGSHIKSRGAVGSNKARGLVEWIKWVLRLHAGYLMSLPGLTSRLAGLHGSLTRRLASHQRLLALQGRLELVLAQIELRGSYDVVSAGVQGVSTSASAKGSTRSAGGNTKGISSGTVWKEDEDEGEGNEDGDEDEDEAEQMSVDDDDDVDNADGGDDNAEDNDDLKVDVADEEGEVDDIGLDSHINGVEGADIDDDEGVPRSKVSRRKQAPADESSAAADVSVASGAATSDESESNDEDGDSKCVEEDEDDEDEDDEDEDDEDEDEDDDDDDDESEVDDDDDEEEEEEGGRLLDLEAEERSDEEEEESGEE